MLLVCVLPLPSAHEAAGATGTRRSPRPLKGESFIDTSGASRREGERVCLVVIASAAKQSILPLRGKMDCFASLAMTARLDGLLRGACHRAHVRATERVGWVEPERYPSIASCGDDGFRRLNPSYALPIPSAHEAAGCNGHPASPRPLWAENSSNASGASRRGIERAFSRHCEPTGRPNGRPMTGSAKQSILSLRGKMDCFASLMVWTASLKRHLVPKRGRRSATEGSRP